MQARQKNGSTNHPIGVICAAGEDQDLHNLFRSNCGFLALFCTSRILSTSTTGLGTSFRIKLVGMATLVSCSATLRSYLTLLLRIHTCEASGITLIVVFCHMFISIN